MPQEQYVSKHALQRRLEAITFVPETTNMMYGVWGEFETSEHRVCQPFENVNDDVVRSCRGSNHAYVLLQQQYAPTARPRTTQRAVP